MIQKARPTVYVCRTSNSLRSKSYSHAGTGCRNALAPEIMKVALPYHQFQKNDVNRAKQVFPFPISQQWHGHCQHNRDVDGSFGRDGIDALANSPKLGLIANGRNGVNQALPEAVLVPAKPDHLPFC